MKVKSLVEALMRLPLDHEIVFTRETGYGRVEYEFDHLELKREILLKEAPVVTLTPEDMARAMSGERKEPAIEETSERCIMVLS